MSFNHASALEAQPPQYRDDPETLSSPAFDSTAENLSVKLFGLTSSISRLRQQIELLGTKRDTERVRERVSDLLEEVREGFKDAGEGVRKLAVWEDLNVGLSRSSPCSIQKRKGSAAAFKASGTLPISALLIPRKPRRKISSIIC